MRTSARIRDPRHRATGDLELHPRLLQSDPTTLLRGLCEPYAIRANRSLTGVHGIRASSGQRLPDNDGQWLDVAEQERQLMAHLKKAPATLTDVILEVSNIYGLSTEAIASKIRKALKGPELSPDERQLLTPGKHRNPPAGARHPQKS